ncbi:hypothetical protein [Trebonia sp.]|uniref:hypothetical protein n=1 Tax=Trebonia sp. TaxID=2767075 RepID=UPI00262A2D78|nr:hypothetical protein [Trebonia sp.]
MTAAAPARLAAARAMSEAALQDHVRALCDGLGLAVQHVHDPRRSWLPGWPDLTVIGSRVIYRELKSEQGTVSAEQRDVGQRLTDAGQDWAVWRPAQLLSGEIGRQLASITGHQIALPLWKDQSA